jgi:predicted DNA-binding transcriptional regulator AlpA
MPIHGVTRTTMRLLDHDAVNERTGPRSKAQRWRDIQAGLFPRPVKVGSRNLWPEDEVDAWIESRIRARDVANPEAA